MADRDEAILIDIRSSSGREAVVLVGTPVDSFPGTVLCALTVGGDFWCRNRVVAEAELTVDFEVSLPQVVVDKKQVVALNDRFSAWMDDRKGFVVPLSPASRTGQSLTISIGVDPGLICSADKPALIVEYACGASMAARWAFIVDQSCVAAHLEQAREVGAYRL
ncbi:hypothetical protein [Lysobacter sp. CA199]|uniref:hypothetical protein n=1 Tax=Lysobacter sp. CA199 TaxID=3455608 RepID=UPI003F8D4FE1